MSFSAIISRGSADGCSTKVGARRKMASDPRMSKAKKTCSARRLSNLARGTSPQDDDSTRTLGPGNTAPTTSGNTGMIAAHTSVRAWYERCEVGVEWAARSGQRCWAIRTANAAV
eukprot:scaffold10043_cov27-Tisochrysis_lutea.AAC.3